MPKIDIETLKFILQRNEPDIPKIAGIMQEIEQELKAEEEEKALRPPPIKKAKRHHDLRSRWHL